jgi:RNA ligase
MRYYIPTFEEAKAITEASEAFYFTTNVVNGYTVHIFNYRLATYDDFVKYDAWELRGLTYIEYFDHSEVNGGVKYQHFILLDKFFNIDQTPATLTDVVRDLEIISIQDKLDGSVISFVLFPTGQILAKSKMSFDNDQSKMAQEYFEKNLNLQKFVFNALEDGYIPIFELVSPQNQIVLQYEETELRLLQLRNNRTGKYLPITYQKTVDLLAEYGVKCASFFTKEEYPELYSIDSLNELALTIEGIEGWVVQFSNGLRAKKKTAHYNLLHGSISEIREDGIIELILNEQIDDMLGMLNEGTEKRKFVEEIITKTSHEFNHLVVEYKELRRKYFQDFGEIRKNFALKHSKDRLFPSVMKGLNTSFRDVEATAEEAIKQYILGRTKTLTKAREFLEQIKL